MHTTINGEAPAFQTTPLYIQARDAVRDRIKAGAWKPGAPIPNEGDLAREMGISSGTMRKALDALEAEGVLTRMQGRGTFVREQIAWDDLPASAKYAIQALGSPKPAKEPARRALVNADGTKLRYITSTDLRAIAEGAIEVAAWIDREADMAKARAA